MAEHTFCAAPAQSLELGLEQEGGVRTERVEISADLRSAMEVAGANSYCHNVSISLSCEMEQSFSVRVGGATSLEMPCSFLQQ